MKTVVFILLVALGFAVGVVHAQNEPNLIPDVVDPAKLIPILPEPPAGWRYLDEVPHDRNRWPRENLRLEDILAITANGAEMLTPTQSSLSPQLV